MPKKAKTPELKNMLEILDDYTLSAQIKFETKINLAKQFKSIADKLIDATCTKNSNLAPYNDAAIHLNYAINITKGILENSEASADLHTEARQILHQSEEKFLIIHALLIEAIGVSSSSVHEHYPALTIDLLSRKTALMNLRTHVKREIELVQSYANDKSRNLDYISTSKKLFDDIAENMKLYLSSLIAEAVSIIGTPPCKFEIIGLGSMAMRQMTPYSDLEFAILTENEDYKADSNSVYIKNYFKNLTHYLHFKIICLNETPLPFSYYDLDLDRFAKKAVSFDLGGKTPLGRKDKEYDLICTKEQMLSYLKNDYIVSSEEKRDHKLSYILENTCYLGSFTTEGDFLHYDEGFEDSLTQGYQTKANEYLHERGEDGTAKAEQRALRILKGNIDSKGNLLKEGDLSKFKLDCLESEGKNFDVKQEIYRVPDRLIYGLGMIYNLLASYNGLSCFDILEILEENTLSRESTEYLMKSVSYANMLRLRSYSFYGEQKDIMDVKAESLETASSYFKLTSDELSETGNLFEFFYTTIPLNARLAEFIDRYDIRLKNIFFQAEEIFNDAINIKAEINFRLANYQAAAICLHSYISHIELTLQYIGSCESDDAYKYKKYINLYQSCSWLSKIYYIYANYDLALRYNDRSVFYYRFISDNEDDFIANYHANAASIHIKRNEFEKAEISELEALRIRNICDAKIELKIMSHLNLAIIYHNLGNNPKAKEKAQLAKKMYDENIISDNPLLSMIYQNLGISYLKDNSFNLAIRQFYMCLKKLDSLYSSHHIKIADCHYYIALAHKGLSNFDKSFISLEIAERIKLSTLGNSHYDLALIYNEKGSIFLQTERINEAKTEFDKALDLRLKNISSTNYSMTEFYNNIAFVYGKLGATGTAINFCEYAESIKKLRFGEKHPELISTLKILGMLYYISDPTKNLGFALEKLNKALTLSVVNYEVGDGCHPVTASCFYSLGIVHNSAHNYKNGESYLKSALKIQSVCLGKFNIETALTYENLAKSLFFQQKYDLAINEFDNAIDIYIHIGVNAKKITLVKYVHKLYLNLDDKYKYNEDHSYKLWFSTYANLVSIGEIDPESDSPNEMTPIVEQVPVDEDLGSLLTGGYHHFIDSSPPLTIDSPLLIEKTPLQQTTIYVPHFLKSMAKICEVRDPIQISNNFIKMVTSPQQIENFLNSAAESIRLEAKNYIATMNPLVCFVASEFLKVTDEATHHAINTGINEVIMGRDIGHAVNAGGITFRKHFIKRVPHVADNIVEQAIESLHDITDDRLNGASPIICGAAREATNVVGDATRHGIREAIERGSPQEGVEAAIGHIDSDIHERAANTLDEIIDHTAGEILSVSGAEGKLTKHCEIM